MNRLTRIAALAIVAGCLALPAAAADGDGLVLISGEVADTEYAMLFKHTDGTLAWCRPTDAADTFVCGGRFVPAPEGTYGF